MAFTNTAEAVAPTSHRSEARLSPPTASPALSVPFMKPHMGEAEIAEVVDTLRSGWLTTGPKVNRFESEFAEAVDAPFAVAVNSCTAALHLAVEALGLREGQAVLVPTMTFAATSEVVLYNNAIPLLVDCDPITGNMDLDDARRKIELLWSGKLDFIGGKDVDVVGMIPVHVGGLMIDVDEINEFAAEFGLWVVEDAAHAFPSGWRRDPDDDWRMCGSNTADVTCYSFYANKTITTGEGGMAVTHNEILAEKMRLMSLHGLSRDAWQRYSSSGSWDYRIVAPGFKYNLTDIAAAIGIHQLAAAFDLRDRREEIVEIYNEGFGDVSQIDIPPSPENRLHSWHLYPIRLRLDKLTIDRNEFIEEMKKNGIGTSVHWRPLHLHSYYVERYGWPTSHFPNATRLWERVISLPLFPSMTRKEINRVIDVVRSICRVHAKSSLSMVA